MFDDKNRDELSHNSHFIAFLEELDAQRASGIQSLHDMPSDRLQQISGRILQLDDVLNLAGWKKIQERRMSR